MPSLEGEDLGGGGLPGAGIVRCAATWPAAAAHDRLHIREVTRRLRPPPRAEQNDGLKARHN